jgi:hypothetical protein
MAVKKKRAVKKRSSVKKSKGAVKSQVRSSQISPNFKLGLVFRNLILFVLLFLISYILSVVSEGEIFPPLFELLWIIFAFISIAFFLALLVLLFLKWLRR